MTFFIKEYSSKNIFKHGLIKTFYVIKEETINGKNYLYLPINKKSTNKYIKKIVKKISEKNIKNVVLSDELFNIQELKKELIKNNIKILNGSYLCKCIILDIIDYICSKTNTKIETLKVSILINEANEVNKKIIIEIANKVKKINIVTSHSYKFKDIENYLYNEKGIIVNISNKDKINLLNVHIIINIDLSEDEINEYNIPVNSIIINIDHKVKIKEKKFNGININGFNITIPDEYKIDGFNNNFVYESMIYKKEYEQARKQIRKDNVKIENLVGEKGIINEKEFQNLYT